MPRRRAAPRLYLDGKRKQWIIRDGSAFIRTGCIESDRSGAEKRLAAYLGQKHQPERGASPLIADVLLVYAREHLPHTKAAKNASYNITSLASWWGSRTVREVSGRTCRDYASGRSHAAARRDLEVLRAAIRYWHREYGPLDVLPAVPLGPKAEPRDRWLTRSEAAKLLHSGKRIQHFRRFVLLGLYTGTRSGALLAMTWDQIDLQNGTMRRRASGVAEDARKRTPPIRLGRRILSHLRRWKRLDGESVRYLCHYDGGRVHKLKRSFPGAARRAGLKGVTPHTLRHTAVTWAMQRGVPIWEAAGYFGMTPDLISSVYGHHHPDHQRMAAEV
jgi:integrase